jgi:RluA family pseudouridine synthase
MPLTIPVLYEDDAVVAVDKPVGLASIPERHRHTENLFTQVQRQVGHPLWVVHRLDKDVSGVLLFAKHARAHHHLNAQFEHRQVNKRYVAMVHGRPSPASGLIDAPIRAYGSGRMGVDVRLGKSSQTRYDVLDAHTPYSLVQAQPATGRRHQLRVHFYHLGHPIVGDPRYGDPRLQAPFERLLLHAQSIAWTALDGAPVSVTSVPGPTFLSVLSRFGLSLP